jgi:hypothetical protein
MPTVPPDPYARLALRDRLELLAFDARLAGGPQALLEALWEAIDRLGDRPRPPSQAGFAGRPDLSDASVENWREFQPP